MARRGQPVLYELLGAAAASPTRTSQAGPSDGHAQPRQSIRVPIGWLWLAAVIALVLMAVAYQIGRSAGLQAGFTRGQEWRIDGDEQSQLATETPDPARTSGPRGGVGAGSRGTGQVDSGAGGAGGRTTPVTDPPRGETLDFSKDPRVKGLNYWIVARTSAEEAAKMVPFIRSNGLEVAVVSDNNPRFVRVVAIPGNPDGRSSEASRRQEAKIKSIGKLWKNAARGNPDFDDTYPEKHR